MAECYYRKDQQDEQDSSLTDRKLCALCVSARNISNFSCKMDFPKAGSADVLVGWNCPSTTQFNGHKKAHNSQKSDTGFPPLISGQQREIKSQKKQLSNGWKNARKKFQ